MYKASGLVKSIILFCLLSSLLLMGCKQDTPASDAPVVGNTIVIDVGAMQDEVPAFYSLRHEGKAIRFFVFRLKGRALAFMDACKTCYPKKLGYEYRDGRMHCRACDEYYRMDELEKGTGNCVPLRINVTHKDNHLLIPVDAIISNAPMF